MKFKLIILSIFLILLFISSNVYSIDLIFNEKITDIQKFNITGDEYRIKINEDSKKAIISSWPYKLKLNENECNEMRNLRFCYISFQSRNVFALESSKYSRPYSNFVYFITFIFVIAMFYLVYLFYRNRKGTKIQITKKVKFYKK